MRLRTGMDRALRLFSWLVLACAASLAFGQSRFFVETKAPADIQRISSQYSVNVLQTVRQAERNVYVVAVPTQTWDNRVQRLQADSSVNSVSSDTEVELPENNTTVIGAGATVLDPLGPALVSHSTITYFGSPVRSGYVQQTATSLIHLPQAQQLFPTGNEIIAVIDTGVDPNHPALKNVLVPGYDFVHDVAGFASELSDLDQSTVAILDQSTVAILDRKNYPMKLNESAVALLDQSTVAILDGNKLPHEFGHGTMVSGLIHLVAPTARIMPLKAFKSDGSANMSDIVSAIYFAVDHGAKVINMSFSTEVSSPSLQQAINYANEHGVVGIASAGNEGKQMTVYPGGYEGVISVGSTNHADLRSIFSNFGTESIQLAAPGEALVTTYPGNNYAAVWGTSFSAALVSGASSLVDQLVPTAQVDYMTTALDQGTHIRQGLGRARLDLVPTLRYAQQGPQSTELNDE